jgi:type I restriction enzyme S subunit
MSWSEVPFDSIIADSAFGPRFSGDCYADDGNVATLRTTDLSPNGFITLDTMPHAKIDEDKFESHFLQVGDLVISRSGRIGTTALFLGYHQPVLPGAFLIRFRLDLSKAHPLFFRLFFNSGEGQERLLSVAQGAAQQNINITNVRKLNVPLPPLAEQFRIAAVLATYDDLIVTNRRRIALLEDAARRLYREWFVRLRFPGHESVPVKNGVPEGWRKRPIAEQTSFFNRGIAPKYDDTAKGRVINQKCIRDGRISMEPARRQSKDVKPDRLVRMGDVLINSTGAGTLGRVAQVRTPIEDCTVDTHVTIARPIDEGSATYFGQALLSLEPVFSEMGKGATNQLELSRSDIGAVEIWQPPQHLHVEFHRLVGPMLVQAEQLSIANLSLEKTRDLLLPKLMSGQLDVSGIRLPEEVAA